MTKQKQMLDLGRDGLMRLLDGNDVELRTPFGRFLVKALPGRWEPLERIRHPNPRLREGRRQMGLDDDIEVWRSRTYEVVVGAMGALTHLSIKRNDRAPIRNWRHFQQIKNEICGPEREAVEVYPAESRLIDTANQYHLWVLPAGQQFAVGGDAERVVSSDADVSAWNAADHPGRQEPWQPGLTMGRAKTPGTPRPGDAGDPTAA